MNSWLLRLLSAWPIRSVIGSPAMNAATDGTLPLEQWLLKHLTGAQRVDRAVVLAFDQHHDEQGHPPLAGRLAAPLYVSNTYVRHLVRQFPKRLLFGASIHPYRFHGDRSAVQMLDEVVAAGAALVKWLPPTQNINPDDERTIAFMRRCGQLRIPLLIHLGPEHMLGNRHPQWGRTARWLPTWRRLRAEGTMPITIVAHAATPAMWPIAYARSHHELLEALRNEFADAPLYTDLAGMALWSKTRWMRRMLRQPALRHKLVQASDFPVPLSPWAFCLPFSAAFRYVTQTRSWLDRDMLLKSYAGVDETIFNRGGELLAERIAFADTLDPCHRDTFAK